MRLNDETLILDVVPAGGVADEMLVVSPAGVVNKLPQPPSGAGCGPTLIGLDLWPQNVNIDNAPLPGGGVGYRWTGTSDIEVTGFVAGTNQCLVVHNASPNGKKIKFKKEDAASTAANRIHTVDEDMTDSETFVFQYDPIRTRWVRLYAHH